MQQENGSTEKRIVLQEEANSRVESSYITRETAV